MSNRLTRKQIKEDIRHDELQTAVTSTFDRLTENRNVVIGAIVAVVVLALGAVGVRALLASRQAHAAEALGEVIKVYAAPIVESGAKPDDAKEPSFASEEARRQRAEEKLEAVDAGTAKDVAELYLAQIALSNGDAKAARQHWQEYLGDRGDGDLLGASVRLNLLRLDRDEGRGEEVASWLEKELEKPEKSLPEDLMLYELGQTYQALGNAAKANETYQRILDDHPTSVYVAKARQETAS